jgi:uncharacterized membrane protein
MNSIGLIYGGLGLLLIAICIPLLLGKIPPNSFYGFRTPQTLVDEKIWYPANRVAGRNLALAGALIMATSLALFLFRQGIPKATATVTLLIVSLALLIGAVVHSFLALRRM